MPILESVDHKNESGVKVFSGMPILESVDHKFPVTFGVDLRYMLTDRLALHGGLSYTYLRSRKKNDAVEKRSVERRNEVPEWYAEVEREERYSRRVKHDAGGMAISVSSGLYAANQQTKAAA
ncbi:hypothetical protein QE152_g41363 [Popillia japonica]|uniref:Uncharacterized protein n=1 Tax=Popillia japonica TaxID=7064 RepID=A0AAW1GV88_POPJA